MYVKEIIKIIRSFLYNGIDILRFKSIKIPFDVGKGLKTNNPHKILFSNNVRIGRYGRLSCFGNSSEPLIKFENNVYIGDFFSAIAGGEIYIKKNTLIASYVAIISENHGMDPECGIGYGKQPLIEKTTTIGENCWIGEKVTILPGVNIGDWSIIGASSVVASDIPSYSIAVGNPAKVIKKYNFESHKWDSVNI